MNTVKWASGSARKYSTTVGPAHDPYARDIVRISIRDRTFRLVSCTLAGDWLEADGVKVAEFNPIAVHAWEKEEQANLRRGFSAMVEALTVFDPGFWQDRLWEKLDHARRRRDPEAYERWQDAEHYYGIGM